MNVREADREFLVRNSQEDLQVVPAIISHIKGSHASSTEDWRAGVNPTAPRTVGQSSARQAVTRETSVSVSREDGCASGSTALISASEEETPCLIG